MHEQELTISSYLGKGFKEINESKSPLIVNVINPIYLQKGSEFVVVDKAGYVVLWDNNKLTSRDLLLTGDYRAILNPGPNDLDDLDVNIV